MVKAIRQGSASIRAWLSLCVLSLLLVVTALVSLAYASPADPLWISGIYDAGDHDDVVWLVTHTGMAQDCAQTSSLASPTLIGVLTIFSSSVHVPPRPPALHPRAPPAA